MELNKIGKELVLDLLNRDNGLALTFEQCFFGPPEALPVTADFRNTRIQVMAKLGGPHRGSVQVTYWRLALDKVLVGTNRELQAEGVVNTLELLDLINARYNLRLTSDDVVVENVDTTILPTTYVLKTLSDSYGYVGQVELQLVDNKTDLKDIIPITTLESNGYPIDPELKEGGLTFVDAYGDLLSAPSHGVDGMTNTNNGEIEVYVGAHTQDTNLILDPVGGVYSFTVGDLDLWELDVGFGLLSLQRGDDLLSLYDLSVGIDYINGGSVDMVVVLDDDGDVGWSIDGSTPSADFIYTSERKVIADSINLGWLKDHIAHAEFNSVGTMLGTWFIKVKAVPKRSIVARPIEIHIEISADPVVA